jgi:hypothetical protein
VTVKSSEEMAVRAYVSDALADCFTDSITRVERLRSGENHSVHRVSYVDPRGDAKEAFRGSG